MRVPHRLTHALSFHCAALLGLLAFSTPTAFGQGAEQLKPGAEHKKLEAAVGEWNYEGTTEASPFGPASKFKGKSTRRMILSGFFLEGREADKSENGWLWEAIFLQGYDPTSKTYVGHSYENDGTINSSSTTISGNTWTTTGSRKDAKGKAYKMRHVMIYSSDGQSNTFKLEYSEDEGSTWRVAWQGSMKRAKR